MPSLSHARSDPRQCGMGGPGRDGNSSQRAGVTAFGVPLTAFGAPSPPQRLGPVPPSPPSNFAISRWVSLPLQIDVSSRCLVFMRTVYCKFRFADLTGRGRMRYRRLAQACQCGITRCITLTTRCDTQLGQAVYVCEFCGGILGGRSTTGPPLTLWSS